MSSRPKSVPDHVTIPSLSGVQVRRMLRHAGESGAEYARYNEHSRTWAYQCVFNQRNVPTRYIESLYLFLGHDRFWSAYTGVVPPEDDKRPKPRQQLRQQFPSQHSGHASQEHSHADISTERD